MQTLTCPQGDFKLERFPLRRKETLRPWDAADEYLLAHCAEFKDHSETVLVLNDTFGALTLALSTSALTMVTDSQISRHALTHNLALNPAPQHPPSVLNCLDQWPSNPALVLIKVPRVRSLLEFQLHRLRDVVGPETVIVAGGMTKEIHRSTLAAFERFIGPTTTSLARKKARLILSNFAVDRDPGCYEPVNTYTPLQGGISLSEYPGVFSRGRLDQGTQLLLANLPTPGAGERLVDLGCGSGLLGLSLAHQYPHCQVEFVDESHLAMASVQLASQADGVLQNHLTFTLADGMRDHPGNVDHIICNPPFHQGRAKGDHVAWGLFHQAHRALKPGGELRIVGNRHLGYHTKLKRIFGGCTVVASNRKFVVLSAVKSKGHASRSRLDQVDPIPV